jgi:hypothetical protein
VAVALSISITSLTILEVLLILSYFKQEAREEFPKIEDNEDENVK